MKVTVAENEEKTKQKTKKTRKMILSTHFASTSHSVSQQYWTQKLLCTANINIFSFKSD